MTVVPDAAVIPQRQVGGRRTLRSLSRHLNKILAYLILGLWVAFTLFILSWIFFSSFKDNRELFSQIWALPKQWLWSNYPRAWTRSHMGDYFLNSMFVCIIADVVVTLISAMASYVLSRIAFRGSRIVFLLFLIGLAVPTQLLMVPFFMLMNSMKLVDTLWALIIGYVALGTPFTVFLLDGFFRSLPSELEDAAAIDGCSEAGVFFRIMLPLAQPGLITALIFNFMGFWSEYLLALVLINDSSRWTLSLSLFSLKTSAAAANDWVTLFAGVWLIILPVFVFFLFMSERVIAGMTLGATKG